MRKLIGLLVVSAMSLLCSCSSKRTNIIVSGSYSGADSKNPSLSCELSVNRISKDVYLEADGINTVEDGINGNFYSLNCVVRLADGGVKTIDFVHLKDAYGGAKGTPVSYVDDHDNWLTPFTSLNNGSVSEEECYYSVDLNSYDFDLFAYLYIVKD